MRLLLSIVFVFYASSCWSQDTLATKWLDEIVVTGEVQPQSLQKSVHKIRIITQERLQAQGATRLQDVLATELNIRFSQDLALGGSGITLQGLAGQNVKVLLDGLPLVGRQGTSNEININQVNVNTIERIEIVEGPMSVIYGSDALAGVINIITKRPDKELFSGTVKIQEESVGKEYGLKDGVHIMSTTLNYKKKSLYSLAELSRNLFLGWKGDSVGRDLTWHRKNQWQSAGLVGYKTDKIDTYYRLDFLYENIYNPDNFRGNEAIDQHYITKRFMHQWQLTAPLNEKLQVNSAVSYSDYSRRTQTIVIDQATGKETLAVGPGQQDETRFDGVTVRGILNYKMSSNLSFQSGYDVNTEKGSGGRLKEGDNALTDYALFLLADVAVTPSLSLKPGLRVLKNSVYQAPPLIPSLNAKVSLSEKHDIRFAYGRGFRAPSLRELYFNFFDASHSIEGNTELEAELSHSFNASWNARWVQQPYMTYTMVAGAFYNDLTNMITTGVKPSNTNITTYLNIDRYKTTGATLTHSLRYRNIEANLGFAYTGRFNQLAQTDITLPSFSWSPEVNSSITFNLPFELYINTFYKFTGKLPYYEVAYTNAEEIHLAENASYHMMDLTAGKNFKKLKATVGVRNLFNVIRINSTSAAAGSGHTTSGARPIGYGRSYFIGMSYQF